MSELLRMYGELRARGVGHHAALKALARRLDVDKDTVMRVLEKAEKERHSRAGRSVSAPPPAGVGSSGHHLLGGGGAPTRNSNRRETT